VSLADRLLVEPLSRTHDRASFSCGTPALDLYLQRQARQDVDRGLAAVFVLTEDSKRIASFYTLSALSVLPQDLPDSLSAKLPRLPLPVTLLGRMAVDETYKGQGIGTLALVHALKRAWRNASEVASWAVIVDAKQGARDFYVKYGFHPFPLQPDRLFLSMKEIAQAQK
jgi:GNAT superfamily N-acetyltransferase